MTALITAALVAAFIAGGLVGALTMSLCAIARMSDLRAECQRIIWSDGTDDELVSDGRSHA